MIRSICYDVTIRLEEDLHSGTGTGGGSLDAIQITGRSGLPVIRATHIKGLLREAGRLLSEMGLYSEQDYNHLFGEEGGWQRSALLMQSLHFQENKENKENKQAPWHLQWTSTAREINRRTPSEGSLRTPSEGSLRTLQYVKAGSLFHGQWLLTDPTLAKFLQDCLQQVTHLGSSRTRGGGLICVESFGPIPLENQAQSLPIFETEKPRIRLILKNLEPLCLPITGYPGNIVPSECYIRGQQLLGALVAYSLREKNQTIAEDLLAGKISIGNAYPLPEQTAKDFQQWTVLPFPLNIYHEKPKPQTPPEQPWWTAQTGKISHLGERGEQDKFKESSQNDDKKGEKLKRPGDREFLFRDNNNEQSSWQRYQPKMAIHMRNQTSGLNVAKEKRENELFSEEEILEDTCFITDILFSDQKTAQTFAEAFAPLLNGQTWLALGRGGRPVSVEVVSGMSEAISRNPHDETKLTLLLTSDLIIRSETLGFYDSLDIKVLQKLLGITDKTINASLKVYKDTITVRGFNYLTRLPKAPVLAIRRGSAFEITGPTQDIKILRQALQQQTALGERTHEGFGRFELNLPIDWENHPPEKTAPKLNSKIGQQETILKAAKKLADKLGKDALSKTQWQYLRQQALIVKNQDHIDTLLENLTKHTKKTAGEVWTKPLTEIKKALQTLTSNKNGAHENQVLFLDALVRYQFARLKKAETLKKEQK
jgi:CRISPR/Cas system CSM-associated protein Csm3 (group 7 of RAMP superfamily)